MKPIIVIVCLLYVGVLSLAAQRPEPSGLVRTADGVLLVWNQPDNYFTLEIKGKLIQPLPQNAMWFKVDGKFFQLMMAAKSGLKPDAAGDKAFAEAHAKSESDHIGGLMQRKLDVKTSWTKLADGADALLWSFDMPKISDKQTVLKQLYISTLKRNHVIGINVPVEPGDDEKRLWQMITDSINTLKPRDKPLKLEDATKQVSRT
jgi:hypothetical protein